MNSVSLKIYVRNGVIGIFEISEQRTKWKRGWYLCIEFKTVWKNLSKLSQNWVKIGSNSGQIPVKLRSESGNFRWNSGKIRVIFGRVQVKSGSKPGQNRVKFGFNFFWEIISKLRSIIWFKFYVKKMGSNLKKDLDFYLWVWTVFDWCPTGFECILCFNYRKGAAKEITQFPHFTKIEASDGRAPNQTPPPPLTARIYSHYHFCWGSKARWEIEIFGTMRPNTTQGARTAYFTTW